MFQFSYFGYLRFVIIFLFCSKINVTYFIAHYFSISFFKIFDSKILHYPPLFNSGEIHIPKPWKRTSSKESATSPIPHKNLSSCVCVKSILAFMSVGVKVSETSQQRAPYGYSASLYVIICNKNFSETLVL